MKKHLLQLFSPVLSIFETGEQAEHYKRSHRIILIIVGALFLFLSLGSAATAFFNSAMGALIPAIIFFCVGMVAVIVGALGSNNAVAKIWGHK
ncbi:MAG: hypothetical protein P8H97_08830 [Pseudomonadales bacterium]|nr:hypothetical protein [Pseudomonadales bacterium]MDG2078748.1 hypothetical protein [Pseudomonadales bacterium]